MPTEKTDFSALLSYCGQAYACLPNCDAHKNDACFVFENRRLKTGKHSFVFIGPSEK